MPNKMTEIKTLQDLWKEKNKDLKEKGITCACGNCDLVSFKMKELKAEAVNDIKLMREGFSLPIVRNDIESYIKWKFNLTEEDLK